MPHLFADKNENLVKICSKKNCVHNGQPQPIKNFHRNSQTPDGYKYDCKDCVRLYPSQQNEAQAAYQKEFNHKNREARRLYRKEWYLKNRDRLKEKKRG